MIDSDLRQYPSYTTIYSPAWETLQMGRRSRHGDALTRRKWRI